MQNPEMTEPAGAGDVPTANYKMVAALAVKKGQLEKAQLPEFVKSRGYVGYAPTQGHIPSGVPVIGHARVLLPIYFKSRRWYHVKGKYKTTDW